MKIFYGEWIALKKVIFGFEKTLYCTIKANSKTLPKVAGSY